MTETIHLLVEKYGLLAVFFGCMAEGESVAVLAGFFAHQHIFQPSTAYAAVFLGAFSGDVLLFLGGRHFSSHPFLLRLQKKPSFAQAHRLVQDHPNLFVLLNRSMYGLRLLGGVAAGLSGIPVPRFLLLNALSALTWAGLFGSLGYVFGLGAEQLIGAALMKHQRLLLALGIGLAAAVLVRLARRHFRKKPAEPLP